MKFVYLVLTFLPATLVSAQPQTNYIEVTGKSIIEVLPDLIYLKIKIAEKRTRIAQRDEKQQRMLDRFKGIGVETKDITIRGLASNYAVKVFSPDDIIVTRQFIVLVHDVDKANQVISILEDLEISNVAIDHLDHSQYEALKLKGLTDAMSAAKQKATALAIVVNQELGRTLFIEEKTAPGNTSSSQGFENRRLKYASEAALSSDKFISNLSFESIEIVNVVFVRFELKWPDSTNHPAFVFPCNTIYGRCSFTRVKKNSKVILSAFSDNPQPIISIALLL